MPLPGRGPSFARQLMEAPGQIARVLGRGAEGAIDKLGEAEDWAIGKASPYLRPDQELQLRLMASGLGAGSAGLERFGQSQRGMEAQEGLRGAMRYAPARMLDEAMGHEPGTVGAAGYMGLAQQAPQAALSTALPTSAAARGASAAREVAPGVTRSAVAGRIFDEAASRVSPAGVAAGAAGSALLAEPRERGSAAAVGAGAAGLLPALVGGAKQGINEVGRAGVGSRMRRALREVERLGFDPSLETRTPADVDIPALSRAMQNLQKRGVEFNRWWGRNKLPNPAGRPPVPEYADLDPGRASELELWNFARRFAYPTSEEGLARAIPASNRALATKATKGAIQEDIKRRAQHIPFEDQDVLMDELLPDPAGAADEMKRAFKAEYVNPKAIRDRAFLEAMMGRPAAKKKPAAKPEPATPVVSDDKPKRVAAQAKTKSGRTITIWEDDT